MSLLALLINTCTRERQTKDKWGKITASVTTAGIRCRIEYRNRVIRDAKGQEVVSLARVFFRSTEDITFGDRLYFDGRYHGIQQIARQQNRGAVHHLEVYVD